LQGAANTAELLVLGWCPPWCGRAGSCDLAPLPDGLRFYDLRHTCASLLIAKGASIKAVQAQLGHATASITLDTYGHLFPSEMEALAYRLGEPDLTCWLGFARRPRRRLAHRGPPEIGRGDGHDGFMMP